MVVACAEDAQVAGCGESSSVAWRRVACGNGVLGDGSLSDIVASLSTDQEALVSESHVEGCSGAFEEICEQTGVDVWLLVEQVQLSAVGLLGWEVVCQDLSFEAFGEVVLEFELGVEAVGGGPCLC